MNRRDPRIRQTINRLTDTLESANLNTQASIWTFSESYLQPCLKSVSSCFESACYPCVGARRDRLRARQRHLSRAGQRGRPELVFDFYNDDWDEEEDEGTGLLGGWGADELDRLLAGSSSEQPRHHGHMNYGSRARRRSTVTKAGEVDPTIMPGYSMFGFLERLPWKIGNRVMRYKPSAADLQDNPGRKEPESTEGEALLDDVDEDAEDMIAHKHQRKRSNTSNSRSTTNSLSSRGDLFPSEDEDDAVALDDEFAMALGRRTVTSDEVSSRKSKVKRPSLSRTTSDSKDTRSPRSQRSQRRQASRTSLAGRETEEASAALEAGLPSMEDLAREEQEVRDQEKAEVERKRAEARQVAVSRGFSLGDDDQDGRVLQDEDYDSADAGRMEPMVSASEPDRSEDPNRSDEPAEIQTQPDRLHVEIPKKAQPDNGPPPLSPGSVD